MKIFRVGCTFSLVALLAGVLGCSSTIEIGVVYSETGAGAFYGDNVKNGLDLAQEEINAAGGFNGKEINLIYKDDQTRAEVGQEAVEALIHENRVKLIIGATSSTVTLKIAPICQSAEVVLISPTASTPKLTDAGDYIFRNYPSDILEGTSMADFARDLGLERVVVLSVNNEFGTGLRDIFVTKYPSKFRKIILQQEFVENDKESFPALAREVSALDPDGIYIIGYMSDLAKLVTNLRASGCEAVIMGNSAVTGEVVQLAGESADMLVYPEPGFDVDSDDEGMSAFVAAFRKKYNKDPNRFAAHGYDSLKLLLKAMEKGGSPHPSTVSIALLGIDNYQGASGRISFDQNGDIVQYPRLFIIWEGEAISYEQFIDEGGTLPIPGRR